MPMKSEQAISKYRFVTSDQWIDSMNGTHLRGSIKASRRILEQVFGKPYEYDETDFMSDGKTTTEWIIEFDDGEIATIYDWKRYEQGPPALDEFITWHIGGHKDTDVVERIHYLTPPF